MLVRLTKKLVKIEKGEEVISFFNYYLKLDNGSSIRIQPVVYKDSNGNWNNKNKILLNSIAEED